MSNFLTPDLYLSAFLKSRGAKLAGMLSKASRVTFEFEGQNLNELVTAFYNNGSVGVMDFTTALRALRGACRNAPKEDK
jgi:hypothetical protein